MEPVCLPNLRVLDLSLNIAGPFCTKLLADYGADVIKLEPPGEGDPARRYGPFPKDEPHPERSGLFLHLNTNKRSITLAPDRPEGAELVRRLAAVCDLVVEGFRPGAIEGWGLGYEQLRRLNPALVVLSITDFGQTGPYRHYRGGELIIQALGGPMHSRGLPDRAPLKYAENTGQYLAGFTACIAALGAVLCARANGEGRWIDCSAVEAVLGSVERGILSYQYAGDIGQRLSAHSYGTFLQGAYPCKDGYVGVMGSGRGESWWPRIYAMMDQPELASDPRFSTPLARTAHRDEFDVLWYSWLADHTREEVYAAARQARFPLAPVNTPQDLVADNQCRAREFFAEVEHPQGGTTKYPGAPLRFQETPWALRRPAPLLGQHNTEVYEGLLGMTAAGVSQLRRQGVV